MKNRLDRKKAICESFAREMKELFGNDIRSVILFGSGATEEYRHGQSDLNFLVVLSEEAIKQIERLQNRVNGWKARRISLPLFMTEGYIAESLDTFPIEFFNMQTAYQVMDGKDVLEKLKFNKEHLRIQCERELKGNLLKLRQGFIGTQGKPRELASLISESMASFISIFRALLFLRGKEVTFKKADTVLAVCREFALDEGLFSHLLSMRGPSAKADKRGTTDVMRRYIDAVDLLTKKVNEL